MSAVGFISLKNLPSETQTAIRNDYKIEAIKGLRNAGWFERGLKECKDYIELHWSQWQSELSGAPRSDSPESPSSSKELPKQDLLLKMLRMTESDNDGQALVAIRKANALLQSAGWTWEKLLSGKITVVADPFASISEIKKEAEVRHAPATSPPPRRPAPPQPRRAIPPLHSAGAGMKWEWDTQFSIWVAVKDYSAPPSNPQEVSGATISSRANNYANHCYCCGTPVDHRDGFIFQGADFGLPSKWNTVCKSCNTSVKTIPKTPAKRKITNSTFQARVPNSAIDNL